MATRSEQHRAATGGSYGDAPATKQKKERKTKCKIVFNESHLYISSNQARVATNYTLNETKGAIKLHSWSNDGEHTCLQVGWYYYDKHGVLHVGNKTYDYKLLQLQRYYNPGFPGKIQSWEEITQLVEKLSLATVA